MKIQQHDDEEDGKINENPLIGMWLEGDSLAPPCQSEPDIVQEVLKFAKIQPHDILYDLGCGDGRVCIAASEQYGIESVGVEIESNLIEKFHRIIENKELTHLITVIEGDLLQQDLQNATIVFTYLLPEALVELKTKLYSFLKHGGRLICSSWGLLDLKEVDKIHVGPYHNVSLYLYDKSSFHGTFSTK